MQKKSFGVRKKTLKTLTELETIQVKKLTIQGSGLKPILKEYSQSRKEFNQGLISKNRFDKMNKTIALIGTKRSLKAWYLVGKDDYYPKSKKTGFIYLYVRKDIRKRGLATKLFYKAVREAVKQGYSRIMVYPHDTKSDNFFHRPELRQYCSDRNIRLVII